MTDLGLCRAVAASYGAAPTITVADIRIVYRDGVLAIPGTRETVAADWIRDLSAWPHRSRAHPRLGVCHDGCLTGAEAVLDAAQAAIGDTPYVMTLHSLGAGVGVILAALLTLWGHPPARIVTFGAMRCCVGADIPGILKDIPGVHYHHGGDPVPELPPWPYREWRERTQLGQVGIPSIPDHFIAAYLAAMSEP